MTIRNEIETGISPAAQVPVSRPRVSVIVPIYATGEWALRYLERCLESAVAAMGPSLEVQVVDDGSPLDVRSVVERFAPVARYARQKNQGPGTAMNRSISLSTGDYVRFLDADDLLSSAEALTEMVEVLDHHPEVGMVYGQLLEIDGDDRVFAVHPKGRQGSFIRSGPEALRALLDGSQETILPTAVLARRSILDRVGGLHPELCSAEEWDMWLRVAQVSSVAYIARPVASYRVHDHSITRSETRVGVVLGGPKDPHRRSTERATLWLAQHLEALNRLFADPEVASRYAREGQIARAHKVARAVISAGEDGQLGLAWSFARKAVVYSWSARQPRMIGEALWYLVAHAVARPLRRRLSPAWRQVRAAFFASRNQHSGPDSSVAGKLALSLEQPVRVHRSLPSLRSGHKRAGGQVDERVD